MSTPSTQVNVAVRIRPLTAKEESHDGKNILTTSYNNSHTNTSNPPNSVHLTKHSFTYDAVYNPEYSQEQLYQSIKKGSLLPSFMEGYNSTIIAYGATGSGKTFTMGSEAESLENGHGLGCDYGESVGSELGLIPRFLYDIFESLRGRKCESELAAKEAKDTVEPTSSTCTSSNDTDKQISTNSASSQDNPLIDFQVSASFLEVYGEDIRDLLSESPNHTSCSLPLREDANGGVIAVGLTHHLIQSAEEALDVLQCGTYNRTTGATLMNSSSSRSHAVFTIHLTQTFETFASSGSSGGSDGCTATTATASTDTTCANSTRNQQQFTTTSKFTFVDLAGSERMKKTGAEGERAKEGIEINKGLLALGNVINALADDEMIARGERMHVPYRQSKLTRLLQDALGGNSQTLFLACVSPSDMNASESLSTLKYANRARNIKNIPTKNMDATAMELQRLYALTHVLQNELVKAKFGDAKAVMMDDDNAEQDEIGILEEDLLDKQHVQDYLLRIHEKVNELQGSVPSSISHNGISLAEESTVVKEASNQVVDTTLERNKAVVHCVGDIDENALIQELKAEIYSLHESRKEIEKEKETLKCRLHELEQKSLPKSGKDRRAAISKEVTDMINSISHASNQVSSQVSNQSSSQASGEVNSQQQETSSSLKAETVALNQANKDTAKYLAEKMHLRGRELVSISIHSIKKRYKDLPCWWNSQVAEDVCRSILGKDRSLGVDETFSRHLDIICESLRSTSKVRETLSKGLKEIVQDAHMALLSTVEGADDASEAYTSFHEALSRLPSLSKEHIHACLEEMNILVMAVEAMSQSEIEALTVVWETLGVRSSERGSFWGRVEESAKNYQCNTESPLDNIRTRAADAEDWILVTLKDANKTYRNLAARLLKLKKIHEEVERLTSNQDRQSSEKKMSEKKRPEKTMSIKCDVNSHSKTLLPFGHVLSTTPKGKENSYMYSNKSSQKDTPYHI